MSDGLTFAEKLGLEELYCRPHSWSAGSREVAESLVEAGLMHGGMSVGRHPMTHKGFCAVREIQNAGMWPPSLHPEE